jgi:cardiolipin synthase A/B
MMILLGLLVAISLAIAMCERAEEKVQFQLRTEIPSSGDAFALAFYQSLGAQVRPGHQVSLVSNGKIFERIAEDIRTAQLHVHFDVFIWQKGRASDMLLDALAARAKGVECRVLVDDVGSPGFEKDIAPRLSSAGCEWRIFRRVPGAGDKLARNHRKIVVIDGRIAFTGGFGIRDEWLGDGVTAEGWRDENIRFMGPAVLDAQQAIAENWQESGGALFPQSAFPADDDRDPDFDPWGPASAAFVSSTASPVLSRAERLVQVMIRAAKRRLWIANAYFVPSDEIIELVKEKASSGVDVRLLVPGKKSDSRISMGSQHVAYGPLTRNHVRVFEYAPAMMHAKTFIVDDEISVVGSINLEPLSFSKLEEDALVVQDRAFNEVMATTFEQDCKHANEIER